MHLMSNWNYSFKFGVRGSIGMDAPECRHRTIHRKYPTWAFSLSGLELSKAIISSIISSMFTVNLPVIAVLQKNVLGNETLIYWLLVLSW